MPTRLIIVTGLLGSGKTTVIKHLCSAPWPGQKPVVVVGEHAREGFDGDMLRATGVTVFELTSGGSDPQPYVSALREVLGDRAPALVLLETSGTADVGTLAQALLRDSTVDPALAFGPMVAVVDASTFEAHSTLFPAQIWAPIHQADVVVINKTDRVTAEALSVVRARLASKAPHAELYDAFMGQVRRAALLDGTSRPGLRARVFKASSTGAAVQTFDSVVYRSDLLCYDRVRFGHLLLNLPGARIVRFKGVLRSWQRSFCMNGMPGQLDWDNTPVEGSTRIAFLGIGLNALQNQIFTLLDDELQAQQDPHRG